MFSLPKCFVNPSAAPRESQTSTPEQRWRWKEAIPQKRRRLDSDVRGCIRDNHRTGARESVRCLERKRLRPSLTVQRVRRFGHLPRFRQPWPRAIDLTPPDTRVLDSRSVAVTRCQKHGSKSFRPLTSSAAGLTGATFPAMAGKEEPISEHHISSWIGRLSTAVHRRPKLYAVATFRQPRIPLPSRCVCRCPRRWLQINYMATSNLLLRADLWPAMIPPSTQDAEVTSGSERSLLAAGSRLFSRQHSRALPACSLLRVVIIRKIFEGVIATTPSPFHLLGLPRVLPT
jgi:hypothetical protein